MCALHAQVYWNLDYQAHKNTLAWPIVGFTESSWTSPQNFWRSLGLGKSFHCHIKDIESYATKDGLGTRDYSITCAES